MEEPLDIGVGDLVVLRCRVLASGLVVALDLDKDNPVSVSFFSGETIDYKMSEVQVVSTLPDQ